MTNDNYTKLTNQELLIEIQNFNVTSKQLGNIIRHQCPKLWDEIIKRTQFLDNELTKNPIFFEIRLFALEHNLEHVPTCSGLNCSHLVHWNRRNRCFSKHCSQKCKYEDPNIKEIIEQENQKRIQTNECKFGTSHPMHLQEFKLVSFLMNSDGLTKLKQSNF